MAKWQYFVIPFDPGPGPARIDDMSDIIPVEIEVGLRRGKRMGDKVFARRVLSMHRKGGGKLTDFLFSIDRLLVGSERAKAFFEANATADEIEYIPFRLKDKKGKLRDERYFIVNPLRRVACLDRKRSDAEPIIDVVSREERWVIVKLQLEEDKIPETAKLFRLAEDPQRILIRSDLLEAVRAAGLTALVEKKVGDFL